jgi:hypothetical protein
MGVDILTGKEERARIAKGNYARGEYGRERKLLAHPSPPSPGVREGYSALFVRIGFQF